MCVKRNTQLQCFLSVANTDTVSVVKRHIHELILKLMPHFNTLAETLLKRHFAVYSIVFTVF
jgi:hypothetical protein